METRASRIQTKHYIGNIKKEEWSSVYYYLPQIPATFEARGEIFAVISLSGPTTFDSSTAGNLLIDQLHEQYFESNESASLIALEKAVLSVKERLLQLLQNDQQSSQKGIELNLIAAVIQDNNLYVVNMGDCSIWGLRDGELANLTEGLRDPDGRGEIKCASLQVEPNDRFLLTTPQASTWLIDEDRKLVLDKFSLNSLSGKYLSNDSLISTLLMGVDIPEGVNDSENVIVNTTETDEPVVLANSADEEIENHSRENIVEESITKTDQTDELVVQENEDKYEEQVLVEQGDKVTELKESFKNRMQNMDAKAAIGRIGDQFTAENNSKNLKTFQYLIVSTFTNIKITTKRMWNKLIHDILQVNLTKPLYSKTNRSKLNWRPILFFGILALVLIFSVGFFVQKQRENARIRMEAENRLNTIATEMDSIESEIDRLVRTYDNEESKQAMAAELSSYQSDLVGMNIFEERRDEILARVVLAESKINREILIEDATLVKELGVIENVNIVDIDILENNIYVADASSGVIFGFDYTGGNVKSLGEDLTSIKTISAIDGNQIAFVDENNERSLGVISLSDGSVNRFPGITQARLGNVVDIEGYKVSDSDYRIYGARTSSADLIQLRKSGDGYSLPEMRLSNKDLSAISDVEVDDGRIFVLDEGRGVRRFYGENEYTNEVKGMINQNDWNAASCLEVDSRYIYVCNSQDKRIAIFSKARGNNTDILDFIAFYDLSEMKGSDNLIDIVADRANGKLFVLTNTSVYSLDASKIDDFAY